MKIEDLERATALVSEIKHLQTMRERVSENVIIGVFKNKLTIISGVKMIGDVRGIRNAEIEFDDYASINGMFDDNELYDAIKKNVVDMITKKENELRKQLERI